MQWDVIIYQKVSSFSLSGDKTNEKEVKYVVHQREHEDVGSSIIAKAKSRHNQPEESYYMYCYLLWSYLSQQSGQPVEYRNT